MHHREGSAIKPGAALDVRGTMLLEIDDIPALMELGFWRGRDRPSTNEPRSTELVTWP